MVSSEEIADCAVTVCPSRVRCRGWCNKHYKRWLLRGDPNDHGSQIRNDDAARFWSYVDKADGCWLWQGSLSSNGYGQFSVGPRTGAHNRGAHRVAWEFVNGAIPDGLHLDHLCRVRHCVNPAHLEPVTPAENLRRSPLTPGARTHCPQGHPYDEANTRMKTRRNGSQFRACVICTRAALRRHRSKKGIAA